MLRGVSDDHLQGAQRDSDDLSEGVQGTLGPQFGSSSAPKSGRGFSGSSNQSSPSTSDVEKSCSGVGESMIFKIQEKNVHEQEKQK